MNSIKAILDKSDYDNYVDYLNIQIDGNFLDEVLDQCMPDQMIKGLIPTLCFRMERDSENEIVWNRILPKLGEKRICPILMCPDDLDFSCTLITVEIEYTGLSYTWKNFAFDRTKDVYQNPETVGRNLEFIPGTGSYEFGTQEYNEFVQSFQDQYLKEQQEWNQNNPKLKYTVPW